MPILKIAPPVIFALVVAIFLGAAPSASADFLCEDSPEASAEGTVCHFPYEESETFEASAKEAVLSGGSFTTTCEKSALTLHSEKSLGTKSGLQGKVEALTFSGCKGSCPTISSLNLPYKALLSATEKGNGSLVLSAEKEAPALLMEKCPLGAKCTYKAEKMTLPFSGAEAHSSLKAEGVAFKLSSGASCPEESKLKATYELQQPGGGRAFAAAAAQPATVFCTVQQARCQVGNRLSVPRDYEAKVLAPGIKFKWGGAVKDTCTTSAIKGEAKTIAAPMLGNVTSWTFGGCTCTTSATRMFWSAKFLASGGAGNGSITLQSGGAGEPVLEMLGCGGVNCNFVGSAVVPAFTGNNPAKIDFSTVTFSELSGGCGTMEIETGVFQVETPKPVWLELV